MSDPTDTDLDKLAGRLAAVDVIDTAPYDDAFFDGFADSVMARIEAGSTEAKVLPMPRRGIPPRVVALVGALAALLALAVLFGPDTPTPPTETIADDGGAELEELGRELGRMVLAAALVDADAPEESLLAAALTPETLLADSDDEFAGWYSEASLSEELDDLDSDQLQSLITRL